LPSARKCSATASVACAARRRARAGWSEVETTTTERARPSSPSVWSRNSRTSRPRSPTRPTTMTSASTKRASMPISVDLPTPEAAKMPMRWPRQIGVKTSSARSPVSSRGPDQPAGQRIRGPAAQRHGLAPGWQRPLAIQRLPLAVDDPAEPGVGRREGQRLIQPDAGAGCQAFGMAFRHRDGDIAVEGDELALHGWVPGAPHHHPVADRQAAAEAFDGERGAAHRGQAAPKAGARQVAAAAPARRPGWRPGGLPAAGRRSCENNP
jgi:hypothetical protein